MYFIIFQSIFFYNLFTSCGVNVTNDVVVAKTVNDISYALLAFLSNSNNDSDRVTELKDKVKKIDSYVVDQDKYAELLLNETRHSNLSRISFYKALIGKNENQPNISKSLYSSMKDRMNRDDMMKILIDRNVSKCMKSARRIDEEDVAVKRKDKTLDQIMDKYLGQATDDHHTFGPNDTYNKYWDPEIELHELEEYSQINARRIFRGERTTVRYYPFMVSIHIMQQFWCGGVLYWLDLVITSAACLQLLHNNMFYRENPKVLSVRIGSNHSRVGGEIIDANEVYFHPTYHPKTLENNIAVIRLRHHVKLSYHRIPKLVSITDNDFGVASNERVLLLGWGVSTTSQKQAFEPLFLQRKILPIYPPMFCKEIYGEKFVKTSMFCAGTVSTGDGACSHDAGGPAIMYGKLVGIISYGPTRCGLADAPTVFTAIGPYKDWIETIKEAIPRYVTGKKITTEAPVDPYVSHIYALEHTNRYFYHITIAPPIRSGKEMKLRSEDSKAHPKNHTKKQKKEENMVIFPIIQKAAKSIAKKLKDAPQSKIIIQTHLKIPVSQEKRAIIKIESKKNKEPKSRNLLEIEIKDPVRQEEIETLLKTPLMEAAAKNEELLSALNDTLLADNSEEMISNFMRSNEHEAKASGGSYSYEDNDRKLKIARKRVTQL